MGYITVDDYMPSGVHGRLRQWAIRYVNDLNVLIETEPIMESVFICYCI